MYILDTQPGFPILSAGSESLVMREDVWGFEHFTQWMSHSTTILVHTIGSGFVFVPDLSDGHITLLYYVVHTWSTIPFVATNYVYLPMMSSYQLRLHTNFVYLPYSTPSPSGVEIVVESLSEVIIHYTFLRGWHY